MKYLLFIVLLVAVLITAGCIGGNKETVVTPTPQIAYVTVTVTPTPTPTPTHSKSFVGTWEHISFSGRITQYTIHEGGTYSRLLKDGTRSSGKWSLTGTDQSTNQYTLIEDNNAKLLPFFYTITNDTLQMRFPINPFDGDFTYYNEFYYRHGTTPPILPNIYSSEPIVGTWETKELTFESPKTKVIIIYTFKPDGTFYVVDDKNDEREGYWRKINDNAYKIKYIGASTEFDDPIVYIPQTNTLKQEFSYGTQIFSRSYSTPTLQKTVIPTPTPTIVRVQVTSTTSATPAIEMVSKDMAYKSWGDVYCYGVLKSNVNEAMTATVKMSLYDKNDVKLGDGSDLVNIDPMGKSVFEAIVFGSDKYTDEFETFKCYIDYVY